jgi:hypothetical protein
MELPDSFGHIVFFDDESDIDLGSSLGNHVHVDVGGRDGVEDAGRDAGPAADVLCRRGR